MMPLVSIVVPVYKAEKYLKTCVESLLTQTYPNVEIILVYDSSTDNSLQICEHFSTAYKNVKLHENRDARGGVSRARNQGIDMSSGEFIMFVDADDWVEPAAVQVLFDGINQSGAGCAIGSHVWHAPTLKHFKPAKKVETRVFDRTTAMQEMFYFRHFGCAPWLKLYRSEVIKGICPVRFNEKIYTAEDALFVFESLSRVDKVFWTSEKLYHYQRIRNSITNSKMTNEKGSINSTKMWTKFDAMHKVIEDCQKNFPEVEPAARAWMYLLGVEMLAYVTFQNCKNPEKKAWLKAMLKENLPYFKSQRKNHLFFRKHAQLAHGFLKVF